MLPFVVRYGTFPIHQLKTRRRMQPILQTLEKSQWWEPARLRIWQEERLRHLLRHAATHVPYYRAQFAATGLELDAASVWTQWNRIPLLSKAVAREQFDRLLATDRPRAHFLERTSGSTGQPTTWRIDRHAEDTHHAAIWRGRHWWRFRLGDPQVLLWGRDEFQGRRKALRDLLIWNKRILPILELSEKTARQFHAQLLRWKPTYLRGYPSSFVQFAQLCREAGLPLQQLKVRGLITTAETLAQADRQLLIQAFGCPVINEYGCTEVQVIAFECPQGSMHLNADVLVVEFLKDGRPVEPGEAGEIVVTDLFNEIMPAIRYRTGDMGSPRAGRCPCGRTLPLMELRIGRETELVRLPDGRMAHSEVFTPPHDNPLFELVHQFRVIQETPGRFRIQAVTPPEHLETVRRHFIELIVSQLGIGLEIDVERVTQIPREPSGKMRYFVSNLRPHSTVSEVA